MYLCNCKALQCTQNLSCDVSYLTDLSSIIADTSLFSKPDFGSVKPSELEKNVKWLRTKSVMKLTQLKVLPLIKMYTYNVLLQNYSHYLVEKLIFPHGSFCYFIAGINLDFVFTDTWTVTVKPSWKRINPRIFLTQEKLSTKSGIVSDFDSGTEHVGVAAVL